jgi:single-stranded DNA-binding protein
MQVACMSAFTLIAGRLTGEPVTRPTRTGGQITFFKLRVANGASLDRWDCSTFSDTARDELDGLSEGDAVSAVGAFRLEPYEHNGERRVALKLTADRVLALKQSAKDAKPKAGKQARGAPRAQSCDALPLLDGRRDFDDSIPF